MTLNEFRQILAGKPEKDRKEFGGGYEDPEELVRALADKPDLERGFCWRIHNLWGIVQLTEEEKRTEAAVDAATSAKRSERHAKHAKIAAIISVVIALPLAVLQTCRLVDQGATNATDLQQPSEETRYQRGFEG